MSIKDLMNEREKLQHEGNILKEVEILKLIVDETKKEYGDCSDEFIKALNELGGSLKYIGKYDEAKKNLSIARDLISTKYGKENLAYANNLLNLIEVKRYAGEVENLEDMYLQIVDIYKKNDAEKTFDFAALANNFGLFYQSQERYRKAFNLHKKSLDILVSNNKPEYLLEYAVTLSNIFVPALKLNYEKLAIDYLYQAIDIFENEVGKSHPLYAATLNNLAIHFFNTKDYAKSLVYFEKALDICLKTMGEESENYKNLKSNYELLQEIIEKEKNYSPKIFKQLNGLELSEMYFRNIVLPAFKEKLPHLLPLCAFGLVGLGSECFGYDDEISRDHDFGPSVCIWMREKDKNIHEKEINDLLSTLPKEYLGFEAFKRSEHSGNRRGLISIEDFYFNLIGTNECPKTIKEWKDAPEEGLAAATNGKIFMDELGEFSRIRKELLMHYPNAIKLNRIATRLVNMSQFGQYNYTRCLRRNDLVTANICLNKFILELIHLVYLLNNKYMVFYKWALKGLDELPILGKEIKQLLNDMIFNRNKVPDVRNACNMIIKELKREGLSTIDSDYLEDFGVDIQRNIDDNFFKNYSPWLD